MAAAPDLLLVAPYCQDEIDMIDCSGNVSLFAVIPGFGECAEKYLAIAPSQSMNAGFTPVGKTLTVAGNSSVHYDVALPDIWSVYQP